MIEEIKNIYGIKKLYLNQYNEKEVCFSYQVGSHINTYMKIEYYNKFSLLPEHIKSYYSKTYLTVRYGVGKFKINFNVKRLLRQFKI